MANKMFNVIVMHPGQDEMRYHIEAKDYDVSSAGFYTIRDEKNDISYFFPVALTIISITNE